MAFGRDMECSFNVRSHIDCITAISVPACEEEAFPPATRIHSPDLHSLKYFSLLVLLG